MEASGDTLILGTRKGLLILERDASEWKVVREAFLGIPVPYAATDPRTRILWACVDHGHWGPNLHRSRGGGASCAAVAAPQYLEYAEIRDGEPSTPPIRRVAARG